MSHTQSEMVYLGIFETAANVVVKAFLQQRPRYLHFNSTLPDSLIVTHVDKLGGALNWSLKVPPFPSIDFYAQEPTWPGQPFAIDRFGVLAEQVTGAIIIVPPSLPQYQIPLVANVAITGQAQLVYLSPGYAIELSAITAELLATTGTNSNAVQYLDDIADKLLDWLQNQGPIRIPLPTQLAIGTIVPAIGPIIDNDRLELRGSL